MAQPVVQTHELTKHFKHPFFFWQVRARALTGLSLAIERGEIFGLLGPNGSGKSTTIKLLLGMLWPTSGEVAVFGRRPSDVAVKRKIGYLPEETNLYRFLTAEETLDFYGRLFGLPRAERRRRVETLLELTGLKHARTRPLGEFSKGMQRRVGLAQALINDPELVILDEPTSGLDPLGTREIKNLILELKAKKKTVILSSHLLDDVEDVCDRVAILYGGKVRAAGTVTELLRDAKRTAVTGEMSPELLAKITAAVRECHAEGQVTIAPASERLETLFLKVVHDAERQHVETSGAGMQGSKVDFLTAAPEGQVLERLATAPAPGAAPASAASATSGLGEADAAALAALTAPAPTVAPTMPTATPPASAATGAAPVPEAPAATPGPRELSSRPDLDLLNSLTKKD